MADCADCGTRITTLRDRGPADRTWCHLADGHDDHEVSPVPPPAPGQRRTLTHDDENDDAT